MKKICNELGNRVHTKRSVSSVRRTKVVGSNGYTITVVDSAGTEIDCDKVVFACHPDQALKILGNSASSKEKEVLGCFKYSNNKTYVHSDESLMPKSKAAWTCWNYIGTSSPLHASKPVYVTYWINKLQNLSHPKPILVSLNPFNPPDSGKTYAVIDYAHPQYSTGSVKAQRQVAAMQGENGTFFCG